MHRLWRKHLNRLSSWSHNGCELLYDLSCEKCLCYITVQTSYSALWRQGNSKLHRCFLSAVIRKDDIFFLQKVDLDSMFVLFSISWSQLLSHPLSFKGIDDVGWLNAQKGTWLGMADKGIFRDVWKSDHPFYMSCIHE